jgi:hypothetical protein
MRLAGVATGFRKAGPGRLAGVPSRKSRPAKGLLGQFANACVSEPGEQPVVECLKDANVGHLNEFHPAEPIHLLHPPGAESVGRSKGNCQAGTVPGDVPDRRPRPRRHPAAVQRSLAPGSKVPASLWAKISVRPGSRPPPVTTQARSSAPSSSLGSPGGLPTPPVRPAHTRTPALRPGHSRATAHPATPTPGNGITAPHAHEKPAQVKTALWPPCPEDGGKLNSRSSPSSFSVPAQLDD